MKNELTRAEWLAMAYYFKNPKPAEGNEEREALFLSAINKVIATARKMEVA